LVTVCKTVPAGNLTFAAVVCPVIVSTDKVLI